MGSKKKAPPAPDYVKLAQEQAKAQQALLQQQTEANRPDQITALGSVKWSQDPTTGRWTQTEEWNPEVQNAMMEALALQSKQIGQVGDLMEQGGFNYTGMGIPTLPTYDKASGDEYAKNFTESLLARVRPQQQRDLEAMETKLRLQGLQPGTEAYNRAYQNLTTSQGDVNAQAQLQGLLAGGQEARNIFGAELQGYGSALQGQQQSYDQALQQYLLPWQTAGLTQGLANNIRTPTFQGFNTAEQGKAADILGASQQQYAQQMQAYNEEKAGKQAKGSSIGSVVGAVGGSFFGMPQVGAALGGAAGGAMASDAALKYDINQMDDEACYNLMLELVPVSWRWTGTNVTDSGIIAQEVEQLLPEVVRRCEAGFLKVSYTQLFSILLGAFRHLAKKEAANGQPAD